MQSNLNGYFKIEDLGKVLVVRINGGPHAVFGAHLAEQLESLVDRADRDPNIHAVVFTGTHPDRFISHVDVQWLLGGKFPVPALGVRGASLLVWLARNANRLRVLDFLVRLTPLWPAVQLERMHQTLLRMNRSGTVFVAALNGSALSLGAEFAWACDVRIMADGDFFIGLPEILFAMPPGGSGSQRLTRLIGTHKSLVAILEGKPFTPAEALGNGAVDEVVPQDQVVARAIEIAEHLGLRSKKAIAAGKRAVYFGSSMSLIDGLKLEHAEFLSRLLSKEAKGLMSGYIKATEVTGELPYYNPKAYAQALASGSMKNIAAQDQKKVNN